MMPFWKESHFYFGLRGSCFIRFLLNQDDMLKKMVSSSALCIWVNYTNRQKPKWWSRPIFHTSLDILVEQKHMDEHMKWSFHWLRSISRCSSYLKNPHIHGKGSNFDYFSFLVAQLNIRSLLLRWVMRSVVGRHSFFSEKSVKRRAEVIIDLST